MFPFNMHGKQAYLFIIYIRFKFVCRLMMVRHLPHSFAFFPSSFIFSCFFASLFLFMTLQIFSKHWILLRPENQKYYFWCNLISCTYLTLVTNQKYMHRPPNYYFHFVNLTSSLQMSNVYIIFCSVFSFVLYLAGLVKCLRLIIVIIHHTFIQYKLFTFR